MGQETNGSRTDRKILIVRSGAWRCALPTDDVVRVVRDLTLYPVPASRLHFLGLAQYGGEPLPVLDLRAMVLGTPTRGRHASTIILGRGRERRHSLLGLAVEEVLRVTDAIAATTSSENAGLVTGAITTDGEELQVVNTKRLLGDTADEIGALHG